MAIPRARSSLLLALLLALTACSGNEQKQRSKEIDSLLSWAATAELVAQTRVAGRVPASYAHRSLGQINDQLSKGAEKLRKLPGDASPLLRELDHLENDIAAAQQAIGGQRSDATAQSLEKIRATRARLLTAAGQMR